MQKPLSFYLYIQKKLLDHCKEKKMSYNKALHSLNAGNSRVPKVLFPIILKELEKMKLIKIQKGYVTIINCNLCDKIKKREINRYYQEVGIF